MLAPGLLALGAAVIALRLAVLLIGVGIRRTAESPRIASFLALRELGRRPAVLRQALPLAAAVTVCLFAIGSYARAASNRSLLAHFEVGADRVVSVSTKPGFDLASAVRRADPTGRQAMAAAFYRSTYGQLLAVDSSRLAAVATWPSGLHTMAKEELARRLAPREPAPVTRPRRHPAARSLAPGGHAPDDALRRSLRRGERNDRHRPARPDPAGDPHVQRATGRRLPWRPAALSI